MSYFSETWRVEVRDEIARKFTSVGGTIDDNLAVLHEVRARSMAEENTLARYKTYSDILRWHGLFAVLGYWLFRLSQLTPSRLWFGLPGKIGLLRFAWDQERRKSTPWWQDIGVLILVGVTYMAILGAWSEQGWAQVTASWVAWLLLVDMLAYHVRVLWFDDLEIKASDERRKVWSHRRILFQALINFAQSLCLFSILYHGYQPEIQLKRLLQASFTVATTLTKADWLKAPTLLVDFQVGVSIFFLVVVFSVVASIGYNRPELGKSFNE